MRSHNTYIRQAGDPGPRPFSMSRRFRRQFPKLLGDNHETRLRCRLEVELLVKDLLQNNAEAAPEVATVRTENPVAATFRDQSKTSRAWSFLQTARDLKPAASSLKS